MFQSTRRSITNDRYETDDKKSEKDVENEYVKKEYQKRMGNKQEANCIEVATQNMTYAQQQTETASDQQEWDPNERRKRRDTNGQLQLSCTSSLSFSM